MQALKLPMNIYYLPGRGGRLETGLGEALLFRGLPVSARANINGPLPWQSSFALSNRRGICE